jgi:hypothetical protein
MSSGPKEHKINVYKLGPFDFPPTIKTNKNEGGRLIEFLLRNPPINEFLTSRLCLHPEIPHRKKETSG